jgi:hypothetical protein
VQETGSYVKTAEIQVSNTLQMDWGVVQHADTDSALALALQPSDQNKSTSSSYVPIATIRISISFQMAGVYVHTVSENSDGENEHPL